MSKLNIEQLPDLDQAVVIETELNPLLFSPGDYADITEILAAIEEDRPPVEISLEKLSKNGIVVKDEMNEYLDKKANSSSKCKAVLKTPLHYQYEVEKALPETDKSHFELGTFCHMAFLEPELFDLCVVEPAASLSSNEGVDTLIKFWEQLLTPEMLTLTKAAAIRSGADLTKLPGKKNYYRLLKLSSNKIGIDEEHKIIIDLIKKAYYSYGGGIIPKLLRGAIFETSMYGTDPSTGLPTKIRPDALNIEENIGANAIISFKTTKAETIEKFTYDSAQYKYELSEGMYLEVASQVTGRKFNAVITIMLQTAPPYLPAVLFWDADDLQNGKYKYHSALQTIKECTESGVFPGFDAMAESGNHGIIQMKQPNWAMKELLPVSIEN